MHITQLDFLAPDFLQNPYPVYEQLRQHPIHYRDDLGIWIVSTYQDVNTLLRDKRLGREILHILSREDLGWDAPPARYAPFYHMEDNSLMEREPPNHTRLKNLVVKAFTPRTVSRLTNRVREVAASLIPTDTNSMDLLEDFAVPLSVTVIAELLGVPQADRAQLRPWSHDIVQMYELGGQSNDAVAMRSVHAVEAFSDYLRGLIEQKRHAPQQDLLSQLVAVEADGERLTMDELIATSILILNAGHEATVNVVGNGVYALIQHPEQMGKLRDNPDLLPTAIEEMMRYDTPLPLFRRYILHDMDYNGVTFKQGQEVGLFYGSANHDPMQFDKPEVFDITRQPNAHLSLGAGIHYCLGAPLARLELQIALQTILAQLHNITLLAPVEYHDTFVFRGLRELKITWNTT